jgi:peptidoglycan/LPS O-acetylase OafA/YrhL
LWKRTLRIEPTYLIFIGLSITWIFVRELILEDGGVPIPTWRNVLFNALYLVPFSSGEDWINPVFWTLGIELQFYLLCANFFAAFRSFHSLWGLLLLSIVSGAMMLWIPNGFVFEWIGFFVVGFYIALWIQNQISTERLALLLTVQTLIIALDKGAYFALIAALASILLVLNPNGGRLKIFQFLGNQSYSLYLIHALVGTTFVNVAMRFLPHTNTAVHWAIVFIALALSIACAQLLYLLVEKPTLEKSKRIAL